MPQESVAVLLATCRRNGLLVDRALRSVRGQSRLPGVVVVVDDGGAVDDGIRQKILELMKPVPLFLLRDRAERGAAGAWNAGLRHLRDVSFDGFVAMLDDDDDWDEVHLATCLDCARQSGAGAVVSGLRLVCGGEVRERKLLAKLSWRQFLTGNPGWQGSNTFVRLGELLAIWGFREGMASCNDRDLAIRLMRYSDCQVAFTGQWTANWYLDKGVGQLSSFRGEAKLAGLRWFWHFYGKLMNEAEARVFFERSLRLFGFEAEEIMCPGADLPKHKRMRGDINEG